MTKTNGNPCMNSKFLLKYKSNKPKRCLMCFKIMKWKKKQVNSKFCSKCKTDCLIGNFKMIEKNLNKMYKEKRRLELIENEKRDKIKKYLKKEQKDEKTFNSKPI